MPGHRGERGAATSLVVGAIAIVLTVSLAIGIVTGYLLATHRVRQAADLAALSGAQRLAGGESGCSVAEATARANGARVANCTEVGDALEFAVTVEARVDVTPAIAGLPPEVSATSSAGRSLG